MSLLVKRGLISVIIPVFNRADLIRDSIHSVLGQSYQNYEVIVIDDGSTDDTPKVVSNLAKSHPQIRLFEQPNAGPGAARELGRLHARGEFIQYLDSDDLLLERKFELQVKALENAPDAAVAYGKTEIVRVGEKARGIAARLTATTQTAMFPGFIRDRWWFTSTPLYRRAPLEAIGPWSALCNEEDWEYDCRLASLGGRLAYVDEFVSLHRQHDDHLSAEGSTDPQKLADRARARAKIYQHGRAYMKLNNRPTEIGPEDWAFFSKYAFLLARQCALAGLTTEARAMTTVSIDANGGKSLQHKVFLKGVKLLGWQRAAELTRRLGK